MKSGDAPMLMSLESAPLGYGCPKGRVVARALIYIECNFRDAISLGDIAMAAHISKFHFARLFRAYTGMSPMQYVRWRRVREAKQLLRMGRDPIVTIATELGYFDHSHFSRSFRSATGLCPNQYLANLGGTCDFEP